ncbi:MAG TPA: hypothetical protein VME24_13275 [Alphaproteobacteria bacterium]|nr:hypothetical protein [Alphaproteobacteria bacterium]
MKLTKLTKMFVLTALTAGSAFVCDSALAQNSTNAPAPGSPPSSQPAGPHMMNRGPNIDMLARILNLTDTQKAQVQPIIMGEYKKMRALRNDTSLTPDDRRAKMKEIRDDTSAQLQAVLTPEQFDKYQIRMHQHHPMSRPMPGVSTNTPAGS